MERTYWDKVGGTVGRRGFLRWTGVGAVGLAGAALLGCGSDDDPVDGTPTPSTPGTPTGGTPTPGAPDDLGQINPSGELRELLDRFPARMTNTGTRREGGVLRIGSPYDLAALDPRRTTAGVTVNHTTIAYNRLLKFDNGPDWDPNAFPGAVTQDLADGWEEPDEQTYVFQLAPGIRWQNVSPLDNRPFSAEDVVFALESHRAAGGPTSNYLRFVDSIEAVDDQTVRITTDRVFADQIAYLASRFLPIFPRELEESGELETTAIGTGPMIMREGLRGERITWERNPDYFRGPVALDGIEYHIMETTARDQALRAKQIDLAQSAFAGVESVQEALSTNSDLKGSHAVPVSGRISFAFQLRKAPWDDIRVRQGVALALNMQQWGDLAYGEGFHYRGPNIPWAMVMDEAPSIAQLGRWYEHDMQEAQQLISAAGVEGHEFDVTYYAYNANYDDFADLTIADLSPLGLRPVIRKTDNTAFNADWTAGQFPDVAFGWKATPAAPIDIIEGYYSPDSPLNRWGIDDPEVTALVEEQAATTDPDQRRSIWKQIWDRDLDQTWYVPFPDTIKFNLQQNWVNGFQFGWYQTNMGDTYDIGNQLESVWLNERT